MSALYEIYADEAWTHQSPPPRRYWCFYGGIFGTESDLGRLDTALRKCIATHKLAGEVKWQNVTALTVSAYRSFVDCLFGEIETGRVRYRQMFCDRMFVREPAYGEARVTDLDVQFKLCYQFLKHSFGIEYLPKDENTAVLVRLDTHSSQKHKADLATFARGIPALFSHEQLSVRVTFHQSERAPRIQVCDLLIGAAGSYGNKMHEFRLPGQRGMTAKQRARLELCEHVYERLRAIDATARGSRGFNWFESTGKDGDRTNLLQHKLRIWKFRPRLHRIDAGWRNSNLGPAGTYLGRQLGPEVISLGQDDVFTF